MVFIYTLKCVNNKYYVGKTNNPKFRLGTHFSGGGSEWTKEYKPIKIMEVIKDCDDYDEDKYTLKYMDRYGINNVRGGSFSRIKLTKDELGVIDTMMSSSGDKCHKCGRSGHFANKCKSAASKKKVYACEYCDKEFDTLKGVKYHERVYCKIKCESDECSDESDYEMVEVYACEKCGKEFDTTKGAKYHERIYCKKKTNQFCKRCGRSGHYAGSCYANTNKNGSYLD